MSGGDCAIVIGYTLWTTVVDSWSSKEPPKYGAIDHSMQSALRFDALSQAVVTSELQR